MLKAVLLGLDFGGTKVALGVSDINGNMLIKEKFSVTEHSSAKGILEGALTRGRHVVRSIAEAQGATLAGVGLSTMGITETDRVIMAPNITGWDQLHIPSTMSAFFPDVPLRIENDIKAAALAELRRGSLKATDSGLFVNLGTGFGVAFTYRDWVVKGSHGTAGEVAYAPLSVADELGYRDGVTPLENLIGGKGIGRRASELFGTDMSCEDVFTLAVANDQANEFVECVVREIAFHVTNLVVAWAPEKVSFGGGVTQSWGRIYPLVKDYFERFVPFPPLFQLAQFGHDAGIFGAIELAMEAANTIL